jgi:hypothetical protein
MWLYASTNYMVILRPLGQMKPKLQLQMSCGIETYNCNLVLQLYEDDHITGRNKHLHYIIQCNLLCDDIKQIFMTCTKIKQ